MNNNDPYKDLSQPVVKAAELHLSMGRSHLNGDSVAPSKPHSDESQLSSCKPPQRHCRPRRRAASFSYSHSSSPEEDSQRDRQRDLALRFRAEHPAKQSPSSGRQEGKEGKEDKEDKAAEEKPRDRKRLYQHWPGKNRFYCGGRCMTGPASDRMSILIAWGLHGAVGCVYFVLAAEYLAESVTMLFPLCSGVLFLLTVVFYGLTAYADPGIIPRQEVFELFGAVPDKYTAKVLDQCVPSREQSSGEEKHNIVQSFKYCTTCRIFRPPRASHCA